MSFLLFFFVKKHYIFKKIKNKEEKMLPLNQKEQYFLIFILIPFVLSILTNYFQITIISSCGAILFICLKFIEKKNKKLLKKILNFL